MSERIDTTFVASGMAAGVCAAGRAFSDSLARDRARARVRGAIVRHEQPVYRATTVAIAQRDLRILLDL